MDARDDVTTMPRMWLWEVAILVSLPIGGYIADLVVNGVDSLGAALAGGTHRGRSRRGRRVVRHPTARRALDPATITGMAMGLVIGAALVGYGTGRRDLVSMGAVNGAAVGTMQALVLARDRSGVRCGGPSLIRLLGRWVGL